MLLAYAMVPVCALRNGFRSLPLRSPLGCPIEACTLFVHLAADPVDVPPDPGAGEQVPRGAGVGRAVRSRAGPPSSVGAPWRPPR